MNLFPVFIFILSITSWAKSNGNNIGSFEKNSFQNDTAKLEKTAEMLNEDQYWKIIDLSLKNTKNQYDQEQYLIKEISKLTPKEMIGFRLRTDKLLYGTYNSEMWCAGYIMNGGCSDDGFEYFRNWVISRGKDVYYKAKKNPDDLVTQLNEETEEYEF